ncbi:MAG: hypothetical protein FIB04_13080 [Gammaproteobacteria bacterium]|nr:hypothetical protein [Gammaproteobacteria bacterium]
MRRTACVCAILAACCGAPWGAASAEEGGGGHYVPGAAASFIDQLPGRPAWAIANYTMHYSGSASGREPIFAGGEVTFGLDSQAWVNSVLLLRQTDVRMLGGSYAFAVAVPLVILDAKGEVTGPLGNTFRARDDAAGIGDITVYPFMVGWVQGDVKGDVRLGVYLPTGAYDPERLANVGKNFWTIEPMATVSWLSSKTGLEVTAFAGFDFNGWNSETDYRSGNAFHLDATLAQHLPVKDVGVLGFGATGFYYQQITGDSGSGAQLLGEMKGRTVGIGPVVSFIGKVGTTDVVAEFKWLPELSTAHRLEGDYLWLKVGASF